jgi:hypothetical protein
MTWGDRWMPSESGAPLTLVHQLCGEKTTGVFTCDHCGEAISPREMRPEPGPGAVEDQLPAQDRTGARR